MKATRSRAWRVGGGGDGVGSVTLGDFHEYLAGPSRHATAKSRAVKPRSLTILKSASIR